MGNMKQCKDLRIVAVERPNDGYVLLKLTDSDPLPAIQAGQFVEIKVEGSPQTFLRRPISVNFVDEERNELWLLIQIVGEGTRRLAALQVGDTLNVLFPLGNGFTPGTADERVLLVGGGVGIAPLLETGAALKAAGSDVSFLLGARMATDLVQLDYYRALGNVYVTTEDGSRIEGLDCQKGFVTNHAILQSGKFDALKICGPMPMMKSVASVIKDWAEMQDKERFCEVSLENKMACGLGVCLCCVEDTKEGHKCVCSEGPVFDVKDLKW